MYDTAAGDVGQEAVAKETPAAAAAAAAAAARRRRRSRYTYKAGGVGGHEKGTAAAAVAAAAASLRADGGFTGTAFWTMAATKSLLFGLALLAGNNGASALQIGNLTGENKEGLDASLYRCKAPTYNMLLCSTPEYLLRSRRPGRAGWSSYLRTGVRTTSVL